jgi:hypothetical protein
MQHFMPKKKFTFSHTEFVDKFSVVIKIATISGSGATPRVSIGQGKSSSQIAKKSSLQQKTDACRNKFFTGSVV